MLTIITFILVLGVLILVHELGHFLTARIFKVKAEEFGFGYPPRIFGWVRDGDGRLKIIGRQAAAEKFERTVWSLNWLPLGGFVKIKGEDGENSAAKDSFAARPLGERFVMLFAGVFMNFMLCFVLLSFGFMVGIPRMVDDRFDSGLNTRNAQVQVISILPDSPADRAGLQVGDSFISLAGEPVASVAQVQALTARNGNTEIAVVVSRSGEDLAFKLTPLAPDENSAAKIGTGLVKTAIVSYAWYESIYRGALATFNLTVAIILAFAKIIADLFTSGTVSADLAGPVGIAVITGQVAKLGWIYVLQFAALLSINLGIINLLPLPALDGGRILFLLIEKIKGSPVKRSREALVHQIGFILILVLMALVIFRDVKNYLF